MALSISEAELDRIVKSVVSSMAGSAPAASEAPWDSVQYGGRRFIGIFEDMNEAIAQTQKGYLAVRAMTVEQREKIITEIRKLTHAEAEIMAKLGVAETGTPAKRALLAAGLGLAGAAVQLKTFWRKLA